MNSELTQAVSCFLERYIPAKKQVFAGNEVGSFIRDTIPSLFYSTHLVDINKYLIKGSVGQGQWATVPWLCIFNKSITTTATKGVYIVYLLSSDGNSLYLTFNQGCTEIRNSHSKRETIEIMRNKAADIVKKIDSRGFYSDTNISLGYGLTELAELYQKGTIFYKEYKKNNIPTESELQSDLSKMLNIYDDYINMEKSNNSSIYTLPQKTGVVKSMSKEKMNIEQIKSYISAKGFSYKENQIENLYLSLKSKPFVILAGTSGTGKSKLAKLFAESIDAEYKLVPVHPDWSDSSDLFGHLDLEGNFVPGALTEFISKANSNLNKPHILCLDEMNLARVEYYLSDFLSIIETRHSREGRIITDSILKKESYGNDKTGAFEKYGELSLPENLYVIGTVNMDETTFPFSKKVLDRANTIEFSNVDLSFPDNFSTSEPYKLENIENDFLKSKYLILKDCLNHKDYLAKVCSNIEKLNQILVKANLHVGYRVRDEIAFYMLNNQNDDLIKENDAFDNSIMQKILPRIQGSSNAVKTMLYDLFKYCIGDNKGIQLDQDSMSDSLFDYLNNNSATYKNSAEKIAFMVRRFEEDGFTSFWL